MTSFLSARRQAFLPARRPFSRERGGMAAVEFSIILPVALLIMSLVVYGGQVYSVQRKVTLGAMTVADIFAQANNTGQATITPAELAQILSYPNLILFPNDPTAVQVFLYQLSVTSSSGTATGTVVGRWANANGTPNLLPCGQQMSVDPSIAAAFTGASTSYVVMGKVSYPFQPRELYFSLGAMTLYDSIMMIPRTAAQIQVQGYTPCT
jgi:Flp pilus assembly protein TadG